MKKNEFDSVGKPAIYLKFPQLGGDLSWEQWKKVWGEATNEATLLGLLHQGFSWRVASFKNDCGSWSADSSIVTQRYCTYLHIADSESGYPRDVRAKAFDMLFGSDKHLRGGVFTSTEYVKPEEISALLYFLRLNQRNINRWDYWPEQLTAEHQWTGSKYAGERLESEIGKILPKLWFEQATWLMPKQIETRVALLRTILWHARKTRQIPLSRDLYDNIRAFYGEYNINDLSRLSERLITFDNQAMNIIREHVDVEHKNYHEAVISRHVSAQLLETIPRVRELITYRLKEMSEAKAIKEADMERERKCQLEQKIEVLQKQLNK